MAGSLLSSKLEMSMVSVWSTQLCICLYSGPGYNVDDIPVDKLHLERALDDDSAAEGVTGHRVTVTVSVCTLSLWALPQIFLN